MHVGAPGRPEPRALSKLTAAAGVVAIALLVTLAWLLYSRADSALEDRAKSQVRDATTLAAQLVGEQMLRFSELVEAHAEELSTLSDAPLREMTAAQRATVRQELAELRRGARGLRSSGFTGLDGRLLLADPAIPDLYGQSFAHRDWFRGVTEVRSPYVSRVFRSAGAGQPKTVTVAALVRARRTRTPIALVTVSLQRRTQELVAEFNRTQGLGLIVTDQAGAVIALSGVSSDRILSMRRDPVIRAALAGESGTRTSDDEIAGYAPVPRIGWTVSARLPKDVALSDVRDLRTLTILLTAVIGLLLATLTMAVLRFQSRAQALEVAAAKRQHAIHLHDGVVQTLTVAQIARQAGDHAAADLAVREALAESKRITSDLLPDDVSPGDLVLPDELR